MSSIPEALQRLHDALPKDPVNDGPIGVDARDVRVLLAWAPILGLAGPEVVVPLEQWDDVDRHHPIRQAGSNACVCGDSMDDATVHILDTDGSP